MASNPPVCRSRTLVCPSLSTTAPSGRCCAHLLPSHLLDGLRCSCRQACPPHPEGQDDCAINGERIVLGHRLGRAPATSCPQGGTTPPVPRHPPAGPLHRPPHNVGAGPRPC